MKTLNVAAAVIKADHKILATRRGYGEFTDMWEFPGGKIESGETSEDALIREIEEELQIEIIPEKLITRVEYDYPHFHLSMDVFLCSIKKGIITLMEHNDAKWLSKDELDTVNWLPADLYVIKHLEANPF